MGANGEDYQNSFTDAVSTEPVTDRASMIAANLLLTAFPELTDEQRSQVLAASEIDSGYPLDASSEGYQRINLAKAFSANVTLSSDRSTILDITFGNAAPTVTVQSDDTQQGGSRSRVARTRNRAATPTRRPVMVPIRTASSSPPTTRPPLARTTPMRRTRSRWRKRVSTWRCPPRSRCWSPAPDLH